MVPFHQRQDVFELGVVGRLARSDVNNNGDLIQLEADGIQRLQPLGDARQRADMADAVVAQFFHHFGLLLERAVLGVMPLDAEGEEW